MDIRSKFFFIIIQLKVNQNKEFILPLLSEGANLEVTSANELYLVKNFGKVKKFHGKIRVLCDGPKNRLIFKLNRRITS